MPLQNENLGRRREINRKRLKILIIDEVDVFFSEKFLGKTFNPIAPLACPEISELLINLYDTGMIEFS